MRLSVLMGLVVFVGMATTSATDDRSKEPPAEYRLTIDGKTTTVIPDREAIIVLQGKPLKILLQSPELRVFHKRGIQFEYPASMDFEYDGSTESVNLWTLDGNDVVILIQQYATLSQADVKTTLHTALRDQYESMKATITESDATLKQVRTGTPRTSIQGVRLEIELGDVLLVQELYTFQGQGGGVALILQDSREKIEVPSAEFMRMKRLIAKSLLVNR